MRITRTKLRDRLYGEVALDSAIDHRIFTEDDTDRSSSTIAGCASEEEAEQIRFWEKQLHQYNKLNADIVLNTLTNATAIAASTKQTEEIKASLRQRYTVQPDT